MPVTGVQCTKFRNLSGFWLLGLCNNFAYVVMLSAAYDILGPQGHSNNGTETNNQTSQLEAANHSHRLVPNCNPIGTGAVLLADILPAVIIKLIAPLYVQSIPYRLRVAFVVFFSGISFPIVAASQTVWLSVLGVVCASVSSGFGEITFLSLSSHFHSDCVSTWSSGTGAAGVFGALSYAGLIAVKVSPRNTLLIMLVVPAILCIVYYLLLVKPPSIHHTSQRPETTESTDLLQPAPDEEQSTWTVREKVRLLKPLLPYMVPLMIVYFAEYFINQGLYELLVFDNIWLSKEAQYRWFQVIYQVGVLVSRSSVNCFRISRLWILPILQMLNVVLLLCQIFLRFIPNIWIIFVIILYEGLLGGAAYVNTFFSITTEIPEPHREYSMGVASISDSFGISIAGAISIPIHNFICTLTV